MNDHTVGGLTGRGAPPSAQQQLVPRSSRPWWVLTSALGIAVRIAGRTAADRFSAGWRGAPRIPAHVPRDAVVDFDLFNPPGASEDVIMAWHALRGQRELVWTPHNGGHWIVTSADAIEAVQMDSNRFSHRDVTLPTRSKPFSLLPLEADPPQHHGYRNIIQPWFTPSVVRSLEATARTLAIELTEQVMAKGECDFVSEFAQKFPIGMFLGLVDLPAADRARLLGYTEGAARGSPLKQLASLVQMHFYLAGKAAQRSRNPGDDMISRMCHATIKGRHLTERELHGMLSVLVFGGLDTVASMMSFIMCFLARNPGHRRRLIANPELIPHAIDEMIRRHGVTNTARYVAQNILFRGQDLRKGDIVQVPSALFGLDPARFENPLEVDFDRKGKIRHAAFGNGSHRCPGSFLGEMELRVFLEEWLKRVPDFEITPGKAPVFSSGLVNCVNQLPIRIVPAMPGVN